MTVHLKKDGRFFAKNKKENGKYEYKYFGRGPEAEAKARAYDNELNKDKVRKTSRTPKENSNYFSEIANAYIKSKTGDAADVTLKNLMWKLDGVIFPAIGHLRAASIDHNVIDNYKTERLQEVGKTTVNCEIGYIQAILNWAVERRYLVENRIAGYKKPKRDDAIIIPPSQDEIKGIFDNSLDHLKRAVLLSYYTGLRPGPVELFSLDWSDIDFDQNIIVVRSAKKNGLRVRMIPIHNDLLGFLKEWRKADNYRPGAIIIWRKKRVKSIKKAWASAKTKAGITRRLRLYDIRHAFATYALANGGDLKATSELLGHTRTDTTTRIYQHVDADQHKETINNLPSIH